MKQVMGTKEDVPGTFSRGGEASGVRVCVCVFGVCVCACVAPSSTARRLVLTGRFCHLTSALGQRAKVISLSQPKVSGKARSSPRGTVGPAPSATLPTPQHRLHSPCNQSDLSPGSSQCGS